MVYLDGAGFGDGGAVGVQLGSGGGGRGCVRGLGGSGSVLPEDRVFVQRRKPLESVQAVRRGFGGGLVFCGGADVWVGDSGAAD